EQALGAYRFARHRRVLDVGGGHGTFAAALARACPGLGIGLFDLPPVVAGAAPVLAQAGLADRIDLHPGDFLQGPLPGGYDAMTLVRILHDH
ncbi:methyltransferase, partial [Acinetobacter baumannii]